MRIRFSIVTVLLLYVYAWHTSAQQVDCTRSGTYVGSGSCVPLPVSVDGEIFSRITFARQCNLSTLTNNEEIFYNRSNASFA